MEHEELIDKYLQGTLSEIEKEQFDSLLENSSIFSKNVALIENLKVVAGTEDRVALRKQMAVFESKIDNEPTVFSLLAYKKYIVAASIILLAVIAGLTFFNPFAANTDQLYASNFEPYKNVVTPIVRGDNEDSDEFKAFTLYENKNYKDAAVQFEALFTVTQRSYLLLYQANALLADNQIKKAIPLLEKHLSYNDELSERGRWYLALAYIKEKRNEEAIILLNEIVQNGSFKKGSAEILLKKLN
ncbi:hypothetical protein GCM10022393_09350 [Aquimarina addita]|uniref:Tetratricopeptide repeat protein n=1 Tax=Aquimarina addita TaxID=870485 RepID=A0ABP7XCH0_9FLAO